MRAGCIALPLVLAPGFAHCLRASPRCLQADVSRALLQRLPEFGDAEGEEAPLPALILGQFRWWGRGIGGIGGGAALDGRWLDVCECESVSVRATPLVRSYEYSAAQTCAPAHTPHPVDPLLTLVAAGWTTWPPPTPSPTACWRCWRCARST